MITERYIQSVPAVIPLVTTVSEEYRAKIRQLVPKMAAPPEVVKIAPKKFTAKERFLLSPSVVKVIAIREIEEMPAKKPVIKKVVKKKKKLSPAAKALMVGAGILAITSL